MQSIKEFYVQAKIVGCINMGNRNNAIIFLHVATAPRFVTLYEFPDPAIVLHIFWAFATPRPPMHAIQHG